MLKHIHVLTFTSARLKSYSGAVEDSGVLGCDSVSLHEWFSIFGRNVVSLFQG
jgi:hypothetical protein